MKMNTSLLRASSFLLAYLLCHSNVRATDTTDLCQGQDQNDAICDACAASDSGIDKQQCCTDKNVLNKCKDQSQPEPEGKQVLEKRDAEDGDFSAWEKRAKYFLGKRAKYFLGKRAKYFLGKRADGPLADVDDEPQLESMLRMLNDQESGALDQPYPYMVTGDDDVYDDEEKRAKYFLGKRGYPFAAAAKRDEDSGNKKRFKYFLGKRGLPFLGERMDEESKRAKYFLGKRDDQAEKRQKYFLGKRSEEIFGMPEFDSDTEKRAKYFLGKRSVPESA